MYPSVTAACRSILGGRVDVESQVGGGSTFRIGLPRNGSQTRELERTEDAVSDEAAA